MFDNILYKTLTIYIFILFFINIFHSKYENDIYYFNIPQLFDFNIHSNTFIILPLLIYILYK